MVGRRLTDAMQAAADRAGPAGRSLFGILGEARRDQSHHLVLGALFLILAIPSPSVAAFFPWRTRTGVDFILGGAALILAGLLNHRFLVRNLERLGAPLSAGAPQERWTSSSPPASSSPARWRSAQRMRPTITG